MISKAAEKTQSQVRLEEARKNNDSPSYSSTINTQAPAKFGRFFFDIAQGYCWVHPLGNPTISLYFGPQKRIAGSINTKKSAPQKRGAPCVILNLLLN